MADYKKAPDILASALVAPAASAAPAVTDTPEFKAALAQMKAEILASVAGQSAPGNLDIKSVLDQLALSIAEMSHQGDARDRPLDPAVLQERREGYERMLVLIAEAQALPKGDPRRPQYKARSKLNLNDTMIDPWKRDVATKKAVPVKFRWCLEPNDAMVPLNDLAERIYKEFRTSRGNKKEYAKSVQRQQWLTDSGLLVEGTPPVKREVATPDDPEREVDFDFGEGPNDPNAKHVRVLGTVHQPARQFDTGAPV